MMEILHLTEVACILLLIHQYLLFIVVFRKVGQYVVIFGHSFQVALSVKKGDLTKQTTPETISLWLLGLKKEKEKRK